MSKRRGKREWVRERERENLVPNLKWIILIIWAELDLSAGCLKWIIQIGILIEIYQEGQQNGLISGGKSGLLSQTNEQTNTPHPQWEFHPLQPNNQLVCHRMPIISMAIIMIRTRVSMHHHTASSPTASSGTPPPSQQQQQQQHHHHHHHYHHIAVYLFSALLHLARLNGKAFI